MNNTIIEMKNTLEGISSRITEAEEWISDLEDRMVKFTAVKQNKEKRMKRQPKRPLGQNKIHQHSHYRGSRRRRERERTRESI